jgi:hypothetical protein
VRDDLVSAAGEGIAKHLAKGGKLDKALLVKIALCDMTDWLRKNKKRALTEVAVSDVDTIPRNHTDETRQEAGELEPHQQREKLRRIKWTKQAVAEPEEEEEETLEQLRETLARLTEDRWEADPEKLTQGDDIDRVIALLAARGMSQGTIALLLTEPTSGLIGAKLRGAVSFVFGDEDTTVTGYGGDPEDTYKPLCPKGISQQAVGKRMAKLRRL